MMSASMMVLAGRLLASTKNVVRCPQREGAGGAATIITASTQRMASSVISTRTIDGTNVLLLGSTRRMASSVLSTRTIDDTSNALSESESPPTNVILEKETKTQHYYPRLFQPLDLGPDIGILPNRALMGSMHSGLEGHSMPRWLMPILGLSSSSTHGGGGSKNGDDLGPMATYFKERANGGVGLMVTGGIAPNIAGWTGPFSSKLSSESEMYHHKVVTDAVHSVQVPVGYGDETVVTPQQLKTVPARICLQILHTGRYGYHPFAVSASSTKSPISPFRARALSSYGIRTTIHDFVRTAVLAKQAGYDGVEIMGSEGYLLSQFLSPRTNQRHDQYGGPLMHRARLPLEIIEQTRSATGPDFIIIFRLSLLDLVDQGLLFEESIELAGHIQRAGATILNTGIGWHEARVPTISTLVPRAAFVFPTKALKEAGVITIPLVATNRINNPDTAESILSEGGADMVSMARPFLADPDLILKSREGRPEEINTCIACNQACLDHVFVGKVASCLVNPRACHETEFSSDNEILPKEQQLSLGVIGAGPAGCAFAIAAAKRGHHVTLYDRDDKIGGQFNMAKRIPGKEEFHETLRYFTTLLKKYKVNIRLNTEVSLEDIVSTSHMAAHKWIVATGVDPRNPRIPGQDHPNVLSYIDVLKHKQPVGGKVAIIGAGGIGFDVAEYLLHTEGGRDDKSANELSQLDFWKEWGVDPSLRERGGLAEPIVKKPARSIYLLQRKKGKVGATLGKTTGWIHRASLIHSGSVQMLNGVQYDCIDSNGNLHITNKDGKKSILEVDNIVICAGQVEKDMLRKQANELLQNKMYLIGGAYEAGELDAKRAIDMGTRLALRIHESSVTPGKHVFTSPPHVEEKIYTLLRRFT